MNKHTPGPWSRDKYGHIVDQNGRDVDFRSMCILSSGAGDRMAMAEANTTLAAAAPELLLALEGIAALYDTDEGCRSTPEYIAARAAIAKATS